MPTFDASIPLSSDSPALFPTQSQDNFSVLNTIISSDHQFNNTPMANDNSGYHNLVHMVPQALPGAGITGIGQLYSRTLDGEVQLCYMDSAGVEYQITPDSKNSSATFKGVALIDNTPNFIFTPSYSYSGILTVMRTDPTSSKAFKTFSVFRDNTKTNSVLLGSSGSFSCLVGFDDTGMSPTYALGLVGDSDLTSCFWTLNIVRF